MRLQSLAHASLRACTRPASIAIAALVGVCALGGCYDPNNVSFDYLKGHVTPEMDGLSERDVDIQRSLAMNEDQTLRMFWRDFGVLWLVDQPSMLSPYYIVSTNGQPR